MAPEDTTWTGELAFCAIVDSSPLPIVSCSPDGTVAFWNRAAEEAFGRPAGEAAGKPFPVLFDGASDGGDVLLAPALRGEATDARKVRIIRPDGSAAVATVRTAPLRDREGTIRGAVAVFPDIEEERRSSGPDPAAPAPNLGRLFQPGPLEPGSVLKGMERLLRRLAGEGNRVSLDLRSGIPCVKAVPGKLEQLVACLVSHARLSASPGGRIAVGTDAVTISPPGDSSHPGIPPGPHVAISVSAAEGSGPPCAGNRTVPEEASRLARECGGRILSGPSEQGGASWTAYLPASAEPEDYRSSGRGGPGTLTPGSGTILLVDDEELVRQPAAEILRTCGYAVIEARNGGEALLLSASHRGGIDLLLTDVVMPNMDGMELARRFRESRPGSRVLLMSGYTTRSCMASAEDGTAFLQKPFTAEGLSMKVRETLE